MILSQKLGKIIWQGDIYLRWRVTYLTGRDIYLTGRAFLFWERSQFCYKSLGGRNFDHVYEPLSSFPGTHFTLVLNPALTFAWSGKLANLYLTRRTLSQLNLELRILLHDLPDRHKNRRSPHFEAIKLWKSWSGNKYWPGMIKIYSTYKHWGLNGEGTFT